MSEPWLINFGIAYDSEFQDGSKVSLLLPVIVELEVTLKEISEAARSIRKLANTLDQKPEALIQGLDKSGEK